MWGMTAQVGDAQLIIERHTKFIYLLRRLRVPDHGHGLWELGGLLGGLRFWDLQKLPLHTSRSRPGHLCLELARWQWQFFCSFGFVVIFPSAVAVAGF